MYVDVARSTNDLMSLRMKFKDGRLNQNGENQNKVALILEDRSFYDQEGTMQFSDITVDQTTGSVILRAVFPNPEKVLLPGMFVRAEIKEGLDDQAILLPQQCVMRDRRGNPYVMIVNESSKAEVRPLTLERTMKDKWLVATGLEAGERVIVEGLQMFASGNGGRGLRHLPATDSGNASLSVAVREASKQKGGGA